MIHTEIVGLDQLTLLFEQVPEKLRNIIYKKVAYLTNVLYDTVEDNLSGRVLKERTGDLKSRIKKHVIDSGDTIVGEVFIYPVDEKALALEYGGKGYYPITPVKAQALRFVSKSGEIVFAQYVNHPPLEERSYLRSAMDYSDMAGLMQEVFNNITNELFDPSVERLRDPSTGRFLPF